MDQQTLSTILFIAAGVVLVLYIMRRRKRKMG
ncbi:MAG: LPXTG cell wall anchor domain-containing protein [Bryobacteraceae bacterium]|jgi:LPXTG-motif cell wall-anchored protein